MMAAAAEQTTESLSFKDKRKFFEKEIADRATGSPKPQGKRFTYLQEHEVAKLKHEEERKLSLTSQEEIIQNMMDENKDFNNMIKSCLEKNPTEAADHIVRTGKTDWRACDRLRTSMTSSPGVSPRGSPAHSRSNSRELSPADLRMLEAEKRAAWRKARLKSLEEEALRSQALIARMNQDKVQRAKYQAPSATVDVNDNKNCSKGNNIIQEEKVEDELVSSQTSEDKKEEDIMQDKKGEDIVETENGDISH